MLELSELCTILLKKDVRVVLRKGDVSSAFSTSKNICLTFRPYQKYICIRAQPGLNSVESDKEILDFTSPARVQDYL